MASPVEAPQQGAASSSREFELAARDGYRLSACEYMPRVAARGVIVVGGATGVPQRFYRRFAEFAAAAGYRVYTVDYRGIGASAPATLRGFDMQYLDWAWHDLAALVDHAHDAALPMFMIGHSFGGHAFGLLPDTARFAGVWTFATGAGWHGWMPRAEQLRVRLMWNLIGPLLTRWKGYLPWSMLGMGEDLPLGVYRQWRQWCQHPRYFFDDETMRPRLTGFARVRCPIVAVNALDDRWATPRSRDAFMAGYTRAAWRGVDIDPRSVGLRSIGHMGYFRSGCEPLWRDALHWFDETVVPARHASAIA